LNEKLVFVVDDEKPLANVLVSILKDCGYDAIAFYNPLEALAASVSLKPDLLLSDFKMPNMDGLTLAVSLTEGRPDCKVLMMTGLPHEPMAHPAYRRFEFLYKPVSFSLLLDKVVEAIGGGAGDGMAQDWEPL
jgi:two-component system chemotaxis response regulator CheY